MPIPTHPYQEGDVVEVIADNAALAAIDIPPYRARVFREQGPHRITQVSLSRVYIRLPGSRAEWYFLPAHIRPVERPAPSIVSRRPPGHIRKATFVPLPLP